MDARNTPVIFLRGQSKANLHLGATINTISCLFIHQDLKPTLRVSLWDEKGKQTFPPFFLKVSGSEKLKKHPNDVTIQIHY